MSEKENWWLNQSKPKLKPRILEQKQMKVQPSEMVRFVSRVTYPADWTETLVDSAVPVTRSSVLVFGWQNFVTSVEVCNKKRETSCQTRDGHQTASKAGRCPRVLCLTQGLESDKWAWFCLSAVFLQHHTIVTLGPSESPTTMPH